MNTENITRFILENDIHIFDEKDNFRKILNDEFSAFSDEMASSSFFFNDIGKLTKNIEYLRENLAGMDLYFRSSANPESVIIKALNFYGVKFSVSTGFEIEQLLSYGIASENILYNGVCKLNRHIMNSSVNGVNLLSYGTLSELRNISKNHPSAELLLRVKTSHVPEWTTPALMNVAAASDECLVDLLKKAVEYKMTVVGLEITLGMEMSADITPGIFDNIKHMIDLSIKEGVQIKYIYISGGVPNHVLSDAALASFQAFRKGVMNLMNAYKEARIMVEPTEFIVESAAELYCYIIGTNCSIRPTDEFGEKFYYINDGLYGSLGSILHRRYTLRPEVIRKDPIIDLTDSAEDENEVATIWGPTCDSMDKVCKIDKVPNLCIGDILRFKNLGAFAHSGATTFNGFSLASTYHVISYQQLEFYGISKLDADKIKQMKNIWVSA